MRPSGTQPVRRALRHFRIHSVRLGLAAMLLLLFSPAVWAQEKQRLSGHVPAAVAQLKPVASLDPARRLHLAIGLPLRNQGALTQLLKDLSDPASPNYRRYLTPGQFTEKFGPTAQDYQAVVDFAKAHGLTATTHPNRVLVDVDGAVADIEKALNVTIRTYQHPTEARQFYAPDREPTLNLAVPILHISGLDNYSPPHPRFVTKPFGPAPKAGQNVSANAAKNAGSGLDGTYIGNDFRAAYVPNTSLTGTGQTVALLEFDGYTPGDITYYESAAGLPNVPLTNVLLDGFNGSPSGNGGEVEVSLDIEVAISIAPGLTNLIVYEAGPFGDWHDILNRMATDNLARQMSCSWYIPRGPADPVADGIFQQMAAQGQSFYSASGDLDAYTGLIPFPGDTPYITEVGGTTLTTNSAGGPWSAEQVWNWGYGTGSGGGISTQYPIPSWQQGISMAANQGSTTMRNVPDVALTADNVYVRADGYDQDVGGTSCAAPLWAGFTALVNQQAVANGLPPVGFVNPAIYAIGKNAVYNSDFNDITTGNNFSPTSPTLFSAATGYDLCTGWGTPKGTALVNALAGPPDPLQVSYASFVATGPLGGPFNPSSQTYTLTNNGTSPLTWTAFKNQTWTALSATSGTLGPGATTTVTWSINAAANALPSGNFSDVVTFTNTTTAFSQILDITLTIATPTIAYFDLGTDPGWSRQGEWAYGTPTGGGGLEFGDPDPTSGATGSNVFGINLSGDYSTTIGGPYYLTTNAISTAGYSGTQLSFQRWLNCDSTPNVYETIDVSIDGVSWTNLFTNNSYVLDNAWTTQTYPLGAAFDNQPIVYIRWGHQVATVDAYPASGWNIDDISILGTPLAQLGLSLSANNVTEGAAPLTATLTLNPPPTIGSVVTLFSSDSTSATVPPSVTIPAGQSSITFPVTIVDNPVLDGTRNVTLTAATGGYDVGMAALVINDNQTATLTVSAPASVGEGASTVLGTLGMSAITTVPVAVSMSSSNTAALQVPSTVTIPPGQTSVNFAITVINSNQINGTQSATITAHVPNWIDGTATVGVVDPVNMNFVLALPATITKGGTATGTVVIAGTLAAPLVVALSTGDPTHLTVPASVTIPAGSLSTTFTLTALSNTLTEGTLPETATATATGFNAASGAVNELDDNIHHFTISTIASPQTRNATFAVTITAQDINGVTMASYTGKPTLSATGASGADPISPTATTAFVAGVWTGNVAINTIDNHVVLTVSGGGGHTGVSNSFNVGIGALDHFAWNTIGSPQAANVPFAVTAVAQDAGNNTVPGFNGTANLSGASNASSTSRIVISEIQLGGYSSIEFVNVSGAAVDISGWTVTAYDWTTWPLPSVTFTVPSGTICPANQIFLVNEEGAYPGTFPTFSTGEYLYWDNEPTYNQLGVLLQDAAGNIVDFVCAFDAVASEITSPVSIPTSQWTGAAIPALTDPTRTFQRTGSADDHSNADWFTASSTLGALNAGLTTPFTGLPSPISVSPAVSGNFAGGVWSGNMTVLQAASQVQLQANDGAGHSGASNTFNVPGAPPSASTLPATPLAGTGGTLSGSVNANGASTTVSFNYGSTTAYSNTIAGTPSPVTGGTNTVVSAALSGLTPGATYHFQVSATNSYGTTNGSDFTFSKPDNNANLSGLALSSGSLSPVFSSNTTNYTVTVPYATTTFTVTPTLADSTATATIYDVVIPSGTPSFTFDLGVGANTIPVLVTAQDGITTKTYTVTINRSAASTNANLSNISLSAGALSPTFATAATSYIATVPYNIASITLTPLVSDNTATVTVNGVAVGTGTPSSPINLAVGANTITTVATAQNGTTIKTYTLVLTRNAAFSSFITVSALNNSRTSSTAVLLGNGKVLVAGGGASGGALATAELYDPGTGLWTMTGSMNAARFTATGTPLPNGKVLVAGGYSTSALSSAEIYDPATGAWTTTGSLHTARRGHTAVLLPNGQVLVSGGAGPGALSSAELYNPATGTWTVINSMNTARSFAGAALLPGGTVLVAGGQSSTNTALNSSEIYNPATGNWTTTSSTMNTARYFYTLTVLPSGSVLAAGGTNGSVLANAEVFNPSSGAWSVTGSMTNARDFHSASLLPNGKVLVAGGVGTTAELYDYTVGTWTPTVSLNTTHTQQTATVLASGKVLIAGGGNTATETYNPASGPRTPASGALTSARSSLILKLLPNGQVLAAGGYNGVIWLNSAELFTPANGTWAATGNLAGAREGAAAALLPAGNVLVAGGYNGSSYLTTSELYNPSNGTWTSTGSLANARTEPASALLSNGNVLVAGGSSNIGSLAASELYNPTTGTWTPAGNLNTARSATTATLLANGMVLAAGGNNNGSYLASTELYNPSTGIWTPAATLNASRAAHTATLLPNGKVLVAGGYNGRSYLASAELYDPVTGTWTITGSLATARTAHTATLLADGTVLVTGGFGTSGAIASAEIYDPASGIWATIGNYATTQYAAAATALPNGRVLIAGGYNGAYLANSALYNPGLEFATSAQPQLVSGTSPLLPGGSLVISGSGFRGVSGASSGNYQDSATNFPIMQLRALEGGQTAFLLSNSATNWSDTSFTSTAVSGFPNGYALATVFTNGIPSSSTIVDLVPSTNASLSNLVLNTGPLTPAFASGTTSYTANVPDTTASVTLTPTVADNTASVTVNGVPVTSSAASSPINLNTGPNTINTIVTAQDGLTTDTYSVVVTLLTNLQNWRLTYFGTMAGSGNTADTADYDSNGIPNLAKYAFGLDPTSPASNQIPQAILNGNTYSITFTQPPGVSGITYGAQWTGTLNPPDWQPVPDTGSGTTHIFSISVGSSPSVFMRLQVTGP